MWGKSILVSAALAGAAVAFAAPAAADLPEGTYDVTMVDGGGQYQDGQTLQYIISSCGPNCITWTQGGNPKGTFHLQGNTWVKSGGNCPTTIDNNTLTAAMTCPGKAPVVVQLAKTG